ncbi:MAG: aminotransferase [Rhodospirillaceae bacterium]|nr:aminotransferase [Rhodospirillaceae bacterium]MDD9916520.1 aminotransferase [Rhodospirillaceae bacterium]MDD9929829.1 aminotransferase [Rhodospirillaceae bacterium]
MKQANNILSGYGTTVFEVMSRLAIEHQSINLGQGFPDEDGPEDVRQVAADALMAGPNQYPPMLGIPELRQAVAAHGQHHYGLDVDWQTEVMVASGATEVLTGCMLGLIEPGDEVVLIEPLYDCYLPIIRRAGGVPKMVRIEPPDWTLPREALAAAFSDKTKLILLNNPMNPAAKVFTDDELSFIAELVIAHDVYAVCDEVYEHIAFDGRGHTPLMTLPGMRDRAIKIGSAGKTFSLTGWKVGYATAAPEVLAPIAKAHQFVTFTTPPNLQKAVAYGLGKDDAYFQGLSDEMQAKRDRFAVGLNKLGFGVIDCQGTYFMFADFRPLGFDGDDVAFCEHITTEAGVTAVPVSAFYLEDGPKHFVRFCFSKKNEVLDAAIDRLEKHFKG